MSLNVNYPARRTSVRAFGFYEYIRTESKICLVLAPDIGILRLTSPDRTASEVIYKSSAAALFPTCAFLTAMTYEEKIVDRQVGRNGDLFASSIGEMETKEERYPYIRILVSIVEQAHPEWNQAPTKDQQISLLVFRMSRGGVNREEVAEIVRLRDAERGFTYIENRPEEKKPEDEKPVDEEPVDEKPEEIQSRDYISEEEQPEEEQPEEEQPEEEQPEDEQPEEEQPEGDEPDEGQTDEEPSEDEDSEDDEPEEEQQEEDQSEEEKKSDGGGQDDDPEKD